MDRPFLRSSMPQPSNSPTISHIPGRRYTVAGSLFVAGQNEEGAEDESDYQRNDDVGLIHNSESDQEAAVEDSTQDLIPSEDNDESIENEPATNRQANAPRKRPRKTEAPQLGLVSEEESENNTAVMKRSSAKKARVSKFLKTAEEMLAEEQQAEEQLAEELLAEDLETVKYFSKIFRDIYEAQDTCKETSKRKMMEIAHETLMYTDVDKELKSKLVKLILHLMGCPDIQKQGHTSVSKTFDVASTLLDRAWDENSEEIPLDAEPHIRTNFQSFIYSLVKAASSGGVNEELNSKVLEICLEICEALLEANGGYAGYVGAVMLSSTAKATFCALESLTLTLLNDSDRTGRHTARSLASLCNPFRDQILELVKTGMRAYFDFKNVACLDTLHHIIMTFPSIALSKESLQMLDLNLESKKISRITSALVVLSEIVKKLGSNGDVKSYIIDTVPTLFMMVKNHKNIAVYEKSLQLLLRARINSWLEEKDMELLDCYLLGGLKDTKLAIATMNCFQIELPDGQQLIKSAAKLILLDFEENEGPEAIHCKLPAISVARCTKIKDFKVAIEYLETAKDEQLAYVMMEIIKEIWKAKIKSKIFGSKMSKIMGRKFETLVQRFKNSQEIMSCLAVIWANSGSRADTFNASLFQIFKESAEADEELHSLIVQAFVNMESPENLHPLREWLKDIMNVFDDLGSFRGPNGRQLARIENLMNALKSADIFLARFKCKVLFAYCHHLLLDLIDATNLEEVDDELVILLSSVEANSLLQFSHMAKTNELCLKNFPHDSQANVTANFQEYVLNVINSKQKVLEMDHISAAVKIEVLIHLFLVLDVSKQIQVGNLDSKLLCSSLNKLIFHSTKASLEKREEVLKTIICKFSGMWINANISQTFLVALGSKMHRGLKELIARGFVDFMDAQWKSCQSLGGDNKDKIRCLYRPYLVILEIVFNVLSTTDKPLELLTDQLQKMARWLMASIKKEDELQKKTYYLFCSKLIDLHSKIPTVLAVIEIFALDLCAELLPLFLEDLAEADLIHRKYYKHFEKICSFDKYMDAALKSSKNSRSSEENETTSQGTLDDADATNSSVNSQSTQVNVPNSQDISEASTLENSTAFHPLTASTPVARADVTPASQQSMVTIPESN